MATVSVTGLEKTISKLRALGRDVDQIVDNDLRESADALRIQVKQNIEAVGAFDTGRLYRSIKVEKLGKCRYAVGTNAEYAAPVEFGTGSEGDPTVPHTTRAKWVYYNPAKGGYRTAYPRPARPFMRPAFNLMRDTVTRNVSRAIVKAWAKEVGL